METGHVEHVVRAERVGVDDRVGHDFAFENWLECARFHIRDNTGIDFSTSFSRLKTGILPAAPRPRLPLRWPPK
jgi:hypothetical protein